MGHWFQASRDIDTSQNRKWRRSAGGGPRGLVGVECWGAWSGLLGGPGKGGEPLYLPPPTAFGGPGWPLHTCSSCGLWIPPSHAATHSWGAGRGWGGRQPVLNCSPWPHLALLGPPWLLPLACRHPCSPAGARSFCQSPFHPRAAPSSGLPEAVAPTPLDAHAPQRPHIRVCSINNLASEPGVLQKLLEEAGQENGMCGLRQNQLILHSIFHAL